MAAVVIVIVMAFFITWTRGQVVTVTPTGPLYIAINTERIITCSISGATYAGWRVIFKSSTAEAGVIGEIVPGINITSVTISSLTSSSSSLIVNTTDTSIIGLECSGTVFDQPNTERINLTIYGVPAAPANLTVQVDSDSLLASWTYDIIETVSVSFNLSLHYSEPSILVNQTVGAADIKSYNFNLEGVRSCDHFELCVGASNIVGQGNDSCIEGSLPYIPLVDMITYSLSRSTANTNFTLTVTVMMPATCQPSVQNSFYILEVIGDQIGAVRSDPISISSTSHLQIYNLPRNSFYNFSIISNNSIGEGSSLLLNFCTNDVQGISICSTMQEGVYNISCNYVSGCNFTGCEYQLNGSNGAVLNGTIMGDEYNTLEISDIDDINNVKINDASDMFVYDGPFDASRDVTTCISTTEPIETSHTTVSVADKAGVSTTTIVIISVVLTILIMLMSAIIVVAVCLCRHGCCVCHESNAKGNGNPIAGSSIESQTDFVLNTDRAPEVAVDSGSQEDNGIHSTADLYSSLNRLNPPQGTNAKEKAAGGDYSQLKQEPLYHVLEKETPQKVEKKAPQEKEAISADPDAPAIPPFCPSGGDSPPPHTEVEQTTSSAADIMYAEVGNIAAKK